MGLGKRLRLGPRSCSLRRWCPLALCRVPGLPELGALGGHSELASCLGRWCRSALGTHTLALPSGLLILRVLSVISSALGSSRRLGGADGGPGGLGRSPQDHLNLTAVERTLPYLVSMELPFRFPDCLLAQVSLPLLSCLFPFPGGTEPPPLCLQPFQSRGSTCL